MQEMNAFTVTISLILYGLSFICFLIPFKKGQHQTGYIAGGTLALIITLTLIGNLDFLVIFIWPVIIMFQIIFISYWTFTTFNKKKTGLIISTILTVGFLLLIMQPWISDWTFNKKDAIKILSFHNIELKDDFKILKNEAGGFRDYYETFTLKLSDNDFNRISQTIKTSKIIKDILLTLPTFRQQTTKPMTPLILKQIIILKESIGQIKKWKTGHFTFDFN